MNIEPNIYIPLEYSILIKGTRFPMPLVKSLKAAKRYARNLLMAKPEIDFIEILEGNEAVYFYKRKEHKPAKLLNDSIPLGIQLPNIN